jgi:hypothetical protein
MPKYCPDNMPKYYSPACLELEKIIVLIHAKKGQMTKIILPGRNRDLKKALNYHEFQLAIIPKYYLGNMPKYYST